MTLSRASNSSRQSGHMSRCCWTSGINAAASLPWANDKGFVSISSSHLPQFAYSLVTQPAGTNSVSRLTTSDFAKQNAAYLRDSNTNLMVKDQADKEILATNIPAKRSSLYTKDTGAVSSFPIRTMPGAKKDIHVWIVFLVELVLSLVTATSVIVMYAKRGKARNES